MSLLFIIIPLLIFVIVDTYASLNVALAVTGLVALAEFSYSYFVSGTIDSFSVFSIFLLIVLGCLSYFKQSRKLFFLKPAILSYATGTYLLISYLMGYDVFIELLGRMDTVLEAEQKEMFQLPQVQGMLKYSPLTLGVACLLHGFVATFAALKLNRWGWFLVAGLGGYAFIFIGLIFAIMMGST